MNWSATAPAATGSAHGDIRPDPTWRWPTSLPGGLVVLFLMSASAYAIGLELALQLIDASGLSSVFFIPAGITVGFLLRLPARTWWVVLAAVGLVEATLDLVAGYSAASTAGFVVANMAEPLVAATLVTRLCGRLDLARIRHVWCYLLSAVVVAPGIAAVIGSAPPALLADDDFWTRLWQWWLGDALGVLLVGSAILVWRSSPDRRTLRSIWGAGQLVGSLLLTIAVLNFDEYPLMFLVLIGVVVAGAVFGARAVAVTALVVASTIAFELAFGSEVSFLGLDTATTLVIIKLQLALFTVAGLVVAAEAHEGALARAHAARAATLMIITERERSMEHQIAIRLQEALLPGAPAEDHRLEVAARYEPGADTMLVGGDWYDLFRLPDGRLGLTVGDVVGSGLEASAAMGRLSTAVAVLSRVSGGPGRLLSDLDRYVGEVAPVDFATATYAVLDPETGFLEYASAGHPPMLLVSADGSTRWLDAGLSPPLYGAGIDQRPQASTTVEPDDLLIAYSDGLIERRGEDISAGLDRLQAAAQRLVDLSPSELCKLLPEKIGTSYADDVVLVALRYRPA